MESRASSDSGAWRPGLTEKPKDVAALASGPGHRPLHRTSVSFFIAGWGSSSTAHHRSTASGAFERSPKRERRFWQPQQRPRAASARRWASRALPPSRRAPHRGRSHTALGTYVDGRIVQATIVREGQEVSVGDWTIHRRAPRRPRPFRPAESPREAGSSSARSRPIRGRCATPGHGDWLEAPAEAASSRWSARSAMVRTVSTARSSGRLGHRLRVVAETVPFGWRAIVTGLRASRTATGLRLGLPADVDGWTPGPPVPFGSVSGACQKPVHPPTCGERRSALREPERAGRGWTRAVQRHPGDPRSPRACSERAGAGRAPRDRPVPSSHTTSCPRRARSFRA